MFDGSWWPVARRRPDAAQPAPDRAVGPLELRTLQRQLRLLLFALATFLPKRALWPECAALIGRISPPNAYVGQPSRQRNALAAIGQPGRAGSLQFNPISRPIAAGADCSRPMAADSRTLTDRRAQFADRALSTMSAEAASIVAAISVRAALCTKQRPNGPTILRRAPTKRS